LWEFHHMWDIGQVPFWSWDVCGSAMCVLHGDYKWFMITSWRLDSWEGWLWDDRWFYFIKFGVQCWPWVLPLIQVIRIGGLFYILKWAHKKMVWVRWGYCLFSVCISQIISEDPTWLEIQIMVMVCAFSLREVIWFWIFMAMLFGWKKFWMLVRVLRESLSIIEFLLKDFSCVKLPPPPPNIH